MVTRRKFIKHGALLVPAFGIFSPKLIRAQSTFLQHRRTASRPGVASASCPADGSPSEGPASTAEAYRFGNTTDSTFQGQNEWTDSGVSRTICKLGFEITFIEGTVSGKTYTAYIYTLTGTTLNAIQATSNGLTGITTTGWNTLTFPTPFATGGASTPYGLAIKVDSVDASNYVWVSNSTTTEIVGHRELWNASGAAQLGSGNDAGIRIYWQ